MGAIAILMGVWAATATAQTSAVTIDVDKSGLSAELSQDQALQVRLPVQMGTGYSWGVTKSARMLRLTESKQAEAARPPMPGGAGTQVLVFQPVAAGEDDIRFGYRRPWERGVKPERIVTLHVRVR